MPPGVYERQGVQLLDGDAPSIPAGLCQCGCGRATEIGKRTRKYRGVQYVAGEPLPFYGIHSSRPLRRRPLIQTASNGRAFLVARDRSRVYWYRIVAQNILGRELAADEIVHHINGDFTDDRPENLAVVTRADHPRVHYATVPLAVKAIA